MRSNSPFRRLAAAAPLVLAVFVVCSGPAPAQSVAPAPAPKNGGSDRVAPDPGGPQLRPTLPPEGGGKAGERVEAPREAPAPPTLDELFDRLKTAKRPEAGQRIAREIEHRWLESGSDTIDLLMARALTAMKANEMPLALDLLDAVVTLKPDYVEGWNKRATVLYARKDLGRSVADIETALRLEPRHFGALYGLATLMKDLGRKKEALAAYRRALELNPHLPNAEKDIKELSAEFDGRDL